MVCGFVSAVPQSATENEGGRAALPLYKTIPAATISELTPAIPGEVSSSREWSRSNGNAANERYSALEQINRSNVNQLEVAWIYRSGDGKGNIQANPVIVDGVMFAPTVGKSIVAIDAETGVEKWRFRLPKKARRSAFVDTASNSFLSLEPEDPAAQGMVEVGYGPAQRGLTYWPGSATHGPRLFFMGNGYLFALDPRTGKAIDRFGDQGAVASSKGSGASFFLGAVAPAVYDNIILAPNQSVVDAFDVITGERLWHYDALAFAVADPAADNGANIWGGIALDEARGIAFISTGDPHPNFVGIDRPGDNPGTCSVIALDVRTGRVLWSFQEIAHNLWDLDTPAAPNLVTITREGKRIDAVAQVTKSGNTLLLDRVSGKPLFPYRLRRAPVSKIPGETTAPYQPALQLPQPFARQEFTKDDVTHLSAASEAFVLRQLEGAAFGWFEPPREEQSVVFYGVHGGAEWPGASFDPTTGWLFVTANEIAWVEKLTRTVAESSQEQALERGPGRASYEKFCAACHGEKREGRGMVPGLRALAGRLSDAQVAALVRSGRNAMPPVPVTDRDLPGLLEYLFERDIARPEPGRSARVTYTPSGFDRLLDQDGYPGTRPPWGTLNAIDLNTGKIAWQVPLGEYEELTRRGVPRTGTENFGGAMVTGGGLVFSAGSRDKKIRAFDKRDGRELWQHELPYGGFAPPATYEVNGRQYIVIAATGGGKLGGETGDAYVAFALPRAGIQKTSHQLRPRNESSWSSGWYAVPTEFAPTFTNVTLRTVLRLTHGGERLRLRYSNAYGKSPLEIGAAKVTSGGRQARVSFGSAAEVTIPPGATIVSDPVDLVTASNADVDVLTFYPEQIPLHITLHMAGAAEVDSLIRGNAIAGQLAEGMEHSLLATYFLTGVEVESHRSGGTIVALGSSSTDGGSSRWPALLARRLAAAGKPYGVANAGISGNRILRTGWTGWGITQGESALDRFGRDVLDQPGLRYVILYQGMNDYGLASVGSNTSPVPTAAEVIDGIGQIAARARQRGVRFFAGTLPPFEGALSPGYYTPEKNLIREKINQWIRTTNQLDGYFDFDRVLADPDHPTRLNPSLDSGDHLHPNQEGQRLLSEAVDLGRFD